MVSAVPLGGLDSATLRLRGGAGGPERLSGDYVWGDHREPYREAGLWGLFRVLAPDTGAEVLRPLPKAPGTGRASTGGGGDWSGPALASGLFVALLAAGVMARRRATHPVPST